MPPQTVGYVAGLYCLTLLRRVAFGIRVSSVALRRRRRRNLT